MNSTDKTTRELPDKELSKATGGITPEELLAEMNRDRDGILPEASRPGFAPAPQKWEMGIDAAEKNAEAARWEAFPKIS